MRPIAAWLLPQSPPIYSTGLGDSVRYIQPNHPLRLSKYPIECVFNQTYTSTLSVSASYSYV